MELVTSSLTSRTVTSPTVASSPQPRSASWTACRAVRTAPGTAGKIHSAQSPSVSITPITSQDQQTGNVLFKGTNQHIPDIWGGLSLESTCGAYGCRAACAHGGGARSVACAVRQRPGRGVSVRGGSGRQAAHGLGYGGPVLVQPVDCVSLARSKPSQFVMILERGGHTGHQPHRPHPQHISGRQRPLAGDALQRLRLHTEFLAEFTYERLLTGLPGSSFPPGSSQRPASSGGALRRAASRRPWS